MIQRIQSIWLFLAAITLICLLVFPLMTKNVDNTEYHLYINGLQQDATSVQGIGGSAGFIVTVALNALSILICLLTIFLFKNRSLQKRLIGLIVILTLVVVVISGFNTQLLPGGPDGAKIKAGAFLPLIAIIFSMLALRGIRKDEQLLRSADRLR